jgi:hypothetical protein
MNRFYFACRMWDGDDDASLLSLAHCIIFRPLRSCTVCRDGFLSQKNFTLSYLILTMRSKTCLYHVKWNYGICLMMNLLLCISAWKVG